mmetsp:Transcript_31657/g.89946  ORF Transcript_31657/g.89946 Transcript_31657/m.89946 type:complete len:189 (-) Transcript_31657:112-678(-)
MGRDGTDTAEQRAAATNFGYLLSTVGLAAITVCTPLCGMLADFVGRTRLMTAGAVGLTVSTPLLLTTVPRGSKPEIWTTMALFVATAASFTAALPAWMVDCFPRKIRYSAVGLGYNLAQAMFGGTAPLMATALATLAPSTLSYVAMYAGVLTGTSTVLFVMYNSRSKKEDGAPLFVADSRYREVSPKS